MEQAPLKGQIIKLTDVLKRKRNAVPKAFQALDQFGLWKEAMQVMEADRIGVGEAYAFVVPESVMEEYGIKSIRALKRPIIKFVKDRYKTKYTVRAQNTAEGPTILICQLAPGA